MHRDLWDQRGTRASRRDPMSLLAVGRQSVFVAIEAVNVKSAVSCEGRRAATPDG